MQKLTQSIFISVAVLAPLLNMAILPFASAAPGDAVMPLTAEWRACDNTVVPYVNAVGYARATAYVGTTGSNVSATIDIDTALPNTRYDVRLIQTPRSSLGCGLGAPGVIVGSLQTDAVGHGSTTVAGPIQSGATGAWVSVERPAEYSQTPAEFYNSQYVMKI